MPSISPHETRLILLDGAMQQVEEYLAAVSADPPEALREDKPAGPRIMLMSSAVQEALHDVLRHATDATTDANQDAVRAALVRACGMMIKLADTVVGEMPERAVESPLAQPGHAVGFVRGKAEQLLLTDPDGRGPAGPPASVNSRWVAELLYETSGPVRLYFSGAICENVGSQHQAVRGLLEQAAVAVTGVVALSERELTGR